LAARYSHIDLDHGQVRGGQESNLTLGLNWYANDYMRVMANFIKVDSKRRGESDDPNILLLRTQIAF
jgi:phosphate-selective porin OprO and OprP